MRKILFVLCLIALITGCKPSYEKAIDNYLNEHLKDPKSYKCIEMGKPGIITPMSKAFVETVKRAKAGDFPMDSINSKLKQIKLMFESKGINPYDTLGWEISHKYRAKNSYGAYEIEEVSYIFDKKLHNINDIKKK